jgi:hypothetical protein
MLKRLKKINIRSKCCNKNKSLTIKFEIGKLNSCNSELELSNELLKELRKCKNINLDILPEPSETASLHIV